MRSRTREVAPGVDGEEGASSLAPGAGPLAASREARALGSFRDPAIENSRFLRLSGVPSDRVRFDVGESGSSEGLVGVVKQLLKEAVPLMASVDDFYDNATPRVSAGSRWSKKSTKTYKGAEKTGGDVTIEVDLLTKKYKPLGQKDAEAWACRRSYHDDTRRAGTASWGEFYAFMKKGHVDTEVGMTDTVANGRTWDTWDAAKDIPPITDIGLRGSEWTDITLAIVEMEHKVGSPLANRVFPVVQMTCQNVPMNEMYVISAPIDRWQYWPTPEGQIKLAGQPNTVVGSYASVEVFRRIPLPKPEPEPVAVTAVATSHPEGESAERPVSRRTLSRTASSIRQSLKRRLSSKPLAPGDAPNAPSDVRAVIAGLSERGATAESGEAAETGATAQTGAIPGESTLRGGITAETSTATEPDASAVPAALEAPEAPEASEATEANAASVNAAGAAASVATRDGAAPGALSAQPPSEEANASPAYRIEWTMATVSDARGILPKMLQNPFVPGKIAEDVPMFTKWMVDNRNDLAGLQMHDEGQLLNESDPAAGQ